MSAPNPIELVFKIIDTLTLKPANKLWGLTELQIARLWNVTNKLLEKAYQNPHKLFLSLIKSADLLSEIHEGTLEYFYKHRNRAWIKEFFPEDDLWKLFKEDLEYLYPRYKKIKVTVSRHGMVIYDNYKKNKFNTLLLTIHSGSWIEKRLIKKMHIDPEIKTLEEDFGTHKLYCRFVLDKGGIWIDNKQSRFICDFNRHRDRAIYANNSEKWIKKLWNQKLSGWERKHILKSYDIFYGIVESLLNAYHFNIIMDGHSMRDMDGRPQISFGTQYIPKFYMPIVRKMRITLKKMGYTDVKLDKPYRGGYILTWLSERYPNMFICSVEVNKKLYMENETKLIEDKTEELAKNLLKVYDV